MNYFKDIYESLSQKHPNQKIFVISDHHFDHINIINYTRNQFSNIEQMNKYIIEKHNQIINDNDIVIFLGDFSFKKNNIKTILQQMKGHKYLIMGNHDQKDLIKSFKDYGFLGVYTTPIKINNLYLSHLPLFLDDNTSIHFNLLQNEFKKDENAINYHGHIHNIYVGDQKHINTTCENLDYQPLFIGYTKDKTFQDNKTLFIHNDNFNEILNYLKNYKQINPNIILSDYMYSLMLEEISQNHSNFYLYGSYSLFKKYGFISNFSDLDLAIIYNDSISKNKNSQLLKDLSDKMYNRLNDIDEINISYIKRLRNMCAFIATFAHDNQLFKFTLDFNLISYNLYRSYDFQIQHNQTILETYIKKIDNSFQNEIYLPSFSCQYLTITADMTNLLLQYLFQPNPLEKQEMIRKKIKYISKNMTDFNLNILEDTLIRFFLRNILFFHTLNRQRDFDAIKTIANNFSFPSSITNIHLLESILDNPNSNFNLILKAIKEIPFDKIPQESQAIIKTLKLNN